MFSTIGLCFRSIYEILSKRTRQKNNIINSTINNNYKQQRTADFHRVLAHILIIVMKKQNRDEKETIYTIINLLN